MEKQQEELDRSDDILDDDNEDYVDEGVVEVYDDEDGQEDAEGEVSDSRVEQENTKISGEVENITPSEKAMQDMQSYMNKHNYTPADYPIYSKDPEWQKLNDALNKTEKLEKQGFLTNDGERITYYKAVDRINESAASYMRSMGVPEDKIQEVKDDITTELYKQEFEAR